MSNWDERFLRLAETVASWSKDPSTKVGCVITRPDNTIASVGYNGFPRHVRDRPSDLEDRAKKYAMTVHAELNAVLNAHERLDGCTAYVTHPPCSQCAAVLIQAGVAEVISRHPSEDLLRRWGEQLKLADTMLVEAGVHIGMID
jgi:dCMP deaminase